jgi:hypothetical protein
MKGDEQNQLKISATHYDKDLSTDITFSHTNLDGQSL